MSDHDDFAFEPVPGIPAPLPAGEDMLWQGSPATLPLAREAFGLNLIVPYLALVVLWRAGSGYAEGGIGLALAMGLPYLGLAIAGVAVILLLAYAQARSAIYTITTSRVLLRVGAALTVTFNIPFSQISAAKLALKPSGTGTIALETAGDTRLAYAALWPHARPWRLAKAQPALRCIPDAARVARLLAEAAEQRMAMPVVTRQTDTTAAPAGIVAAE
jgi:hypothetical protein